MSEEKHCYQHPKNAAAFSCLGCRDAVHANDLSSASQRASRAEERVKKLEGALREAVGWLKEADAEDHLGDCIAKCESALAPEKEET